MSKDYGFMVMLINVRLVRGFEYLQEVYPLWSTRVVIEFVSKNL